MSENLSLLSGRKGLKNNLFDQLVEKSKKSGSPDNEEIKELAREFLMGEANIYGAASFYDFLKAENKGKKAYVCNGSACLLAGTQRKVKEQLQRSFKEEEIGHMTCLGRCHENSAFHLNGKNYSGLSESQMNELVDSESSGSDKDDYFIGTNMEQPILTAKFPGIDAFYKPFLKTLNNNAELALKEIKASGIRGRGGAGFPIGLKLESCRNTESDIKFIVCNADEGDPGAYSDKYLMEHQPHSVLFGMLLAGYVAGATQGVLYIRAEYPRSVEVVKNAISDLEDKKLIGSNIQGSGFSFYFKVIEGAGSYVCGEETALLSSIEGQRPEVRVRPPFPAQEGLFRKPTLVNNVETLAMVHHIIVNGGNATSNIGTEKSSGPKLVCLDSFFNRPGLYEVKMGTPLKEIVEELGKGFKEPVKALHIGGPLGGIVPVNKINDLNLDFESFDQNGFLLGHASIISIPEDYPMVKYLEHLFEFTANESCGKCFPCSIGSVRGKEMLEKAQNESDFTVDRKLMDDLLETLEIGSLCALGGGLPLGIKNALQYFEDELKEFIA
jgi:NADH-quinone oxidoreductase subunit F